MANYSTWSKEVPSGASLQRQFDDLYRSDKSILEATLDSEHYFNSSSKTSAGVHRLGSARIYTGTRSQLSNPSDAQGRLFWASDTESLHFLHASSHSTVFARSGDTLPGNLSVGTYRMRAWGFSMGEVSDLTNGAPNYGIGFSTQTAIASNGSIVYVSGYYGLKLITGSNVLNIDGSSGDATYNGNTIWHAGNDGAGTGLDADTVDGQHASAFATTAQLATKADLNGSASENFAAAALTATSLNLGGATLADILTATVVWDIPSTAADAFQNTTVAVAGAAVGDVVLVGPASTGASFGERIYGYVSSANTVTLVFQNLGGVTVDPASTTFRVVVLKF